MCPAYIEDIFFPVLLDTGANCTVISVDVLESICPDWRNKPNLETTHKVAKVANDTTIEILGVKLLSLKIGQLEKRIPFNIINHGRDILIGTDALKELDTVISLSKNKIDVTIGGQPIRLIDEMEYGSLALSIKTKVVLKPNEIKKISFSIEESIEGEGQLGVVFSGSRDQTLIVPSLDTVKNNEISAVMKNDGNKKIVLKKNTKIGRVQLVSNSHDIFTPLEAVKREWKAEEIPFVFQHPSPTFNGTFYGNVDQEIRKKICTVRNRDIPSDTEFILGSGESEGMFEIEYPRIERSFKEIIESDLEERLVKDDRETVIRLLEKYSKVVAKHNYDCGRLQNFNGEPILMNVPLRGKLPRLTRSYNLSPSQQAELETMFDYLIFHGLAKECDSTNQFGSPVFLIKRKVPPGSERTAHSANRIIFDVRTYNTYIDQAVSTPSVSVHSAIDKLNSRARWVTQLDLKQAYYSIQMDQKTLDSGLTQVYGQNRVIQLQRAVTGLSSVPNFFQKTLEGELGVDDEGKPSPLFDGKINDSIFWYDDANLITTVAGQRGKEIHTKLLSKVLHRLNRMNLRISLRKCSFLCNLDEEYLTCLGFQVGKGLVKPDPKKVKNLLELPPPSNLKNLQSLLGSLNFIRGCGSLRFGHYISQLSHLSSSKKDFKWTEESQKCFENIKEILASKEMGTFASDKNTIKIVYTDSSTVAYGGIVFSLNTSDNGLLKASKIPDSFTSLNKAFEWHNRLIKHCDIHQMEVVVHRCIESEELFASFMHAILVLHNLRFPYNTFEDSLYFSKHLLYSLHHHYAELLPLFGHDKEKILKFLKLFDTGEVTDNEFSDYFEYFLHAIFITTEISVCIIFLNKFRTMKHPFFDLYKKPGRQFFLGYQDGMFFPILLTENFWHNSVEYESNLNVYIKDVRDPKIILDYFHKVMEDEQANKYVRICRVFSKVIPEEHRNYAIYCHEAKALLLTLEDSKELIEESPICICLLDSRTSFHLFNPKVHDSCTKSARYSMKLNLHYGNVRILSISSKKNISDFLTRLNFHKKDFVVNTLTPVIVDVTKTKKYENKIYSMSEIKLIAENDPEILILSDKKWKGTDINLLYDFQNATNVDIVNLINSKSESLRIKRFQFPISIINVFERILHRHLLIDKQREEFSHLIEQIRSEVAESSEFNLKNDLLYFDNKLVVPESLHKIFVLKEHFLTVHAGIQPVFKSLVRVYHFPDKTKLLKIIKLAQKSCLACMSVRPNYQRKNVFGVFHMPEKGSFFSIQMDLIENLPGGYNVFAITDLYSKFISCYLIKDKTSENITAALCNYLTMFPTPRFASHDNASCFVSEKTRKFFEFYNISIIKSIPYHGPSRACIERANLSIQQALMSFGFNQDISFKYLFMHAIYLLNSRETMNCNLTPYELQFRTVLPSGYRTRMFRPEILSDKLSDHVNISKKVLEKERNKFNRCIKYIEQQLKDKRQARVDKLNEVREQTKIKVGDYVLILDYKKWLGRSKKLRPIYLDTPFKVTGKSSRGWGLYLTNLASNQTLYRGPFHCKQIPVDSVKDFEGGLPESVYRMLNTLSLKDLEAAASAVPILAEDLKEFNDTLDINEAPMDEEEIFLDFYSDKHVSFD